MERIEKLTHQIIEFYEKLSSWEHSVVRGKDLTLPQMHTVEILGVSGAMRMKELAEKMGVTTGTLTVLIDRLEDKNVVERRPNEEDRRSILVSLTDLGREYFHEHDKLHRRLTEDITSELTPEETEILSRLLGKMSDRF